MRIRETIGKLEPRASEAHKGDFGRVCVIGGSVGMSGAAALAGRSALRAGAGLVKVATPQSVLPIVAAIEPCYTTMGLAEDLAGRISSKAITAIQKEAGENDVIAFGCGIGKSRELRMVLETLLKDGLRLIIDADGLNNLSGIKGWYEILRGDIILTPHPGEMKRLWNGLFREDMPQDRKETALRFAEKTKTVVVLKGAGTVVSDGEEVYVNSTGNPGMATGGSGDVLTGVISALAAQGMASFDAAIIGVHVHGLAGDIASEKHGEVSLIASDITEMLGEAFRTVQ